MTNFKGNVGSSMRTESIKPAHLQKKKNNYSYKSHLNGPVKITKPDGTIEVQPAMTGQQIAEVIKNKKK
jgi:hypothetical protein